MKTKILTSIKDADKNQWNNLVKQSNLGCFFQKYNWLKSIEEGTNANPKHIVVSKDTNLVGFLPNFIDKIKKTPFNRLESISLGFGGPIISSGEKDVLNLILNEVSALRKENIISHKIRCLDPSYTRYSELLKKNDYKPSLESCRLVIDLDKDWEEIKSEMSSGRRRDIRKAHEQDYNIVDLELKEENLNEFYSSYKNVIKRLNSRPMPRHFFSKIRENIKNKVKIFRANINGENRGSLFFIKDEERSSLHYFFSAVEEKDFKYSPSELIHEHAIKWAIKNGFDTYDFGSTSSDFTTGLFKYKENYGSRAVPSLVWEKSYSKMRYKIFNFCKKVYSNYR